MRSVLIAVTLDSYSTKNNYQLERITLLTYLTNTNPAIINIKELSSWEILTFNRILYEWYGLEIRLNFTPELNDIIHEENEDDLDSLTDVEFEKKSKWRFG